MEDRVGQHFGQYHLIEKLGAGGFAEVYLGEHVHLKTLAALKILQTQLSGEEINTFREEARTLAHLNHPHIVRVLDFGIEHSIPYLVMDYAPNGTLRQRHAKGTPLPLSTIIFYVTQVAEALQYIHDAGLIHRDIKPENMLIDLRQNILLSDFGVALISQQSISQHTQEPVGTVAYMSPEQIIGKPRFASDQYSLAVVVYEWLTGERPFRGSFPELYGQHLNAPPPPLRARLPMISPEVEEAVNRALSKDPQRRFATIQAFAGALEAANEPANKAFPAPFRQPVPVTPPPAPETPPPMPFAMPELPLPAELALRAPVKLRPPLLAEQQELGTPVRQQQQQKSPPPGQGSLDKARPGVYPVQRETLAIVNATQPMMVLVPQAPPERRRYKRLLAFEIGKYPITNSDYRRFVTETGHKPPLDWTNGIFPLKRSTHPVIGISQEDAQAYCQWLSDWTEQEYRLPTTIEWEWAASGPKAPQYPWGNRFEAERCNTKEARIGTTTPVEKYSTSMSFCGAHDMSGNVSEIVLSEKSLARSLAIVLGETLMVVLALSLLILLLPLVIFAVAGKVSEVLDGHFILVSLLVVLLIEILSLITAAIGVVKERSRIETRGGSWKELSDKATCFFAVRQKKIDPRATGFRLVRKLE